MIINLFFLSRKYGNWFPHKWETPSNLLNLKERLNIGNPYLVHDILEIYLHQVNDENRTRSCSISLSATTWDGISYGSSTQKFDGANSEKEKHIDRSGEISTDLLNENDTQQSFFCSIKRNLDYIHAEAILKSPLFSAPEEFNDAKTWLKVMKENL